MSVKLWSSTVLILLGHLSRYLIHINSCSNIISLRSHSHSGAITALTFSESGLISASEDCTICMWDVVHRVIIWRFNHGKGAVTNMTVIPQPSLLSVSKNQRVEPVPCFINWKVSSASQLIQGNTQSPFLWSFLWRKADFHWFPKHWFIAAAYIWFGGLSHSLKANVDKCTDN